MAKAPTFPLIIDRCLTISIADLKRWGCLKSEYFRSGTVHWDRAGERVGSIGYSFFFGVESGNADLSLNYTFNGYPVKYDIPIFSVPANIGKGVVWYFQCPTTGQRCKKLHLIDGRFVHRSAAPGAMYRAQTHSKKWRMMDRFFDAYEIGGAILEAAQRPYFKETYKGKQTRHCMRLLRAAEKVKRGLRTRFAFE
ncbi:MAG: hypothetical protein JNM22_10260 [Saprospiraceae bacterium]|nr:hypothetical protein [Saprospiraceae bacterium]